MRKLWTKEGSVTFTLGSTVSLPALIVFTKECVNTLMNINILVAEKGGGGPQAPWAPLLDPPLVVVSLLHVVKLEGFSKRPNAILDGFVDLGALV